MPPSLDQTQRAFFQALLEPLKGRSRRRSDLPPSEEVLSDEFVAVADEYLIPGAQISALEGLELYHRQYWYRLLGSIEEDFPQVRRFLGDELFWELIEDYLIARPSQSFTLRHLGAGFPDFARGWSGVQHADREKTGVIAEVEYAMMEAFEAKRSRDPDENDFTKSRLTLQPHVRLIVTSVAPVEFVNGGEKEALLERPSLTVVWRTKDNGIYFRDEERSALPLLEALRDGGTVDELVAKGQVFDPMKIQEWFGRWQSAGWIGVDE